MSAEASVDELLNLVRFGPIEGVRLLGEKSCVFISFLDGSTAAAFHADASVKKLALHGQELRIGWGKPSVVPTTVAQAVAQHQATRNVFLGNLDENTNEQDLRNELSKYGPIDQVKIVRDKNIGFIHFLSIGTAMKVSMSVDTELIPVGRAVTSQRARLAGQARQFRQGRSCLMSLLFGSPLVGPLRLRPKGSTSCRPGCTSAGCRSDFVTARSNAWVTLRPLLPVDSQFRWLRHPCFRFRIACLPRWRLPSCGCGLHGSSICWASGEPKHLPR